MNISSIVFCGNDIREKSQAYTRVLAAMTGDGTFSSFFLFSFFCNACDGSDDFLFYEDAM